uniref:Uncharacterized protein n=1 Tax=Syphacia muris TaxID=451379 RepID=A0A0N5AK19_9BILA
MRVRTYAIESYMSRAHKQHRLLNVQRMLCIGVPVEMIQNAAADAVVKHQMNLFVVCLSTSSITLFKLSENSTSESTDTT